MWFNAIVLQLFLTCFYVCIIQENLGYVVVTDTPKSNWPKISKDLFLTVLQVHCELAGNLLVSFPPSATLAQGSALSRTLSIAGTVEKVLSILLMSPLSFCTLLPGLTSLSGNKKMTNAVFLQEKRTRNIWQTTFIPAHCNFFQFFYVNLYKYNYCYC